MKVEETVQFLSERMPEIRRRFGVRELAIFGSVARNEARADSDVDVLVDFAERPTFDNYMGLKTADGREPRTMWGTARSR